MAVYDRNHSSSYVYGNTARDLQAIGGRPVQESAGKKKHVRRAYAGDHRRFRIASVVFLSLAVVAIMMICHYYLDLTAEMKGYVSEISDLELKLADLQIENDYQMDMINDSIDLNEVRQIAVERLGMHEPYDGQVVGYSYSEDSYMRQYRDIPEAGQTALLNYLD